MYHCIIQLAVLTEYENYNYIKNYVSFKCVIRKIQYSFKSCIKTLMLLIKPLDYMQNIIHNILFMKKQLNITILVECININAIFESDFKTMFAVTNKSNSVIKITIN